jgi:hypothetical protein
MVKIILQDKWFFSFLIGWATFFLLVEWKTISRNVWGGLFAIALELWQDGAASVMGIYYFNNVFLTLFDIPVFFTFGIVFTMGVIFFQFIPQNPDLQLLHLLMFSAGFLIFEYIVTVYGMLVLPYWSLPASFFDNVIIFGSMLWMKRFLKSKVKWRV